MTAPQYGYHLRTLAKVDEFEALANLLALAFGDEFPPDERERDQLVFEPARSHVFEYDGEIVANAAAYTRQLTVPGGLVPATHVTLVGVHPGHRRRGLLTRLMAHQLREAGELHGEPVALLWASEGRIYQRFGYGLAALRMSYTIDNREVRLNQPADPAAGRLRDVAPATARDELRQVYERLRATRPGWSSRDDSWWSARLLDPSSSRQGQTERRALLVDGPAGADGYALWRRKAKWEDAGGPAGEVMVHEVVAATPQAYQALWRYLLTIDLSRTVRYWCAATDEPLNLLVNEPRALAARTADSLWVRLVDVGGALSARRYAAPVDVVLDVSDALLPDNAGRWRLTGTPDAASCRRTTDDADLACDIADLGAAYLGGTSLGALAAAGRVRELRAGCLARASAAFGWYRAPSAVEMF